jgi:hypothetical protein
VSRRAGEVRCEKWGEYIKHKDSNVTYYQPLYDCLDIVPTSFDIPWQMALLTEGPSDASILQFISKVLNINNDFVIYPGSSASNLDTLISLNLGWQSDFLILLDSDSEGNDQRERYLNKFDLSEDDFVSLPPQTSEIEDMFLDSERLSLIEIVFGVQTDGHGSSSEKKQFFSAIRILSRSDRHLNDVDGTLSSETKDKFRSLLSDIRRQLRRK